MGGVHYTISSKGWRADGRTQLHFCLHARVRQGMPSFWQPHESMISANSLPCKAPKLAGQLSLMLCVGLSAMDSAQFGKCDTAQLNSPQQRPLKISLEQDTPLASATPGMSSPAACLVCI